MSLVVDSLHWLERLVFESRQQRLRHTELPRLYRARVATIFFNYYNFAHSLRCCTEFPSEFPENFLFVAGSDSLRVAILAYRCCRFKSGFFRGSALRFLPRR